MILLIDNYDSFSYNLFQLIGSIEPDIQVIRNDEHSIPEIEAMAPEAIVLSPGPGKPGDAGICIDVVRAFAGKIPILGVCLGHQAICEAYGATVSYAGTLMHGKKSNMDLDSKCRIFKGLPDRITGARYHSLAAIESTMPEALQIVARSEDGEIMAVCHANHSIYGLQFHPESILTPEGRRIVENFIGGIRDDNTSNSLGDKR